MKDNLIPEKPTNKKTGEKKALFFDLDGTLLDENEIIPRDVYLTLERVKAHGHMIFVNTGRAKAYLPEGIGKDPIFDGIICGGAYGELHGKTVFNILMPENARREILNFAFENSIPMIFEGVDENYAFLLSRRKGYVMIPDDIAVDDFIGSKKVSPTKATFFRRLFDIDCSGIKSANVIKFKNYAEALTLGCSKASAMKKMLETVCLPEECSVAFGDSENDNDMLIFAGISVAMPNAAESTKDVSDIVAGICDAISIIGL